MLEVKIQPESELIRTPLSKLQLPPQILVAGILHQEKMLIPHGSDEILTHDCVFFVGEYSAIKTFETKFSTKKTKVERVLIIVAGRIGRHLALLLEQVGLSVKVIDKNRERCQELAGLLQNGLTLCGEGTDIDLLVEEGVGEADAVICLTDDDKLNLLLALMSKHLGAQKTFVRVGRSDYIPLTEKVGVDVVLSPRLLTAGVILRQVRSGEIVSFSLLEGAKAEAMEIIVSPHSPVAMKKLKSAKLPHNCLIASIVRGDNVIIPDGNSILEPGDRVVIISLPNKVQTLLKVFENKLGSK